MNNTEDDVLTIEDGVVTKCKEGLVNLVIPAGIKRIEPFTIRNSYKTLESVVINEWALGLGFFGFESLKSVQFGRGVTMIGYPAFSKCTALESIKIPESVTEIDSSAFEDCTALKTVELPSSLLKIENKMFKGCTALESIKIPEGVTVIGENAFEGCTALKSVEIPSTVTKIESYAFAGCTALESIVIPDSVERICWQVFSGCKALKSIVIGSGVEDLGQWAFDYCTSLSQIEFRGTVAQWDNMGGLHDLLCVAPVTSVKCSDGEWKKGTLMVKGGTLIACVDKSATSVTVPDTVKEIHRYAFDKCDCLESVVISEGVEEIDGYAFNNCKALKYIEIPSTMRIIYKGAFSGCGSVEKIVSHSALYPFNEKTGKLYDARKAKKEPILEVQAAKEEAKQLKIKQIQKVSAMSLFSEAIKKKGIEDYAVESFIPTKTVNIIWVRVNENNVIYKVKANAFDWISDVPKIVDALSDKEKSSREIFDSLMKAKLQPFEVSKNLPHALTLRPSKDGKIRFFSQGLLRKISFLYTTKELEIVGVTKIEKNALSHRGADYPLETLIIADGVEKIGESAFGYLNHLVSTLLPESVTEIGQTAFRGCTALSQIEFRGTLSQWNAVEKGEMWNKNIPAKVVHCSDGDAEI